MQEWARPRQLRTMGVMAWSRGCSRGGKWQVARGGRRAQAYTGLGVWNWLIWNIIIKGFRRDTYNLYEFLCTQVPRIPTTVL